MQDTDKVIIDGALTTLESCGVELHMMLSVNYIYQNVHTLGHKALNLSDHIAILNTTALKIHDITVILKENEIQRDIEELLVANRYPKQSNKVVIRVFPYGIRGDENRFSYMIEVIDQLLYNRYTVWHTRPMLEVFPCECPNMGYATSVSLLCAKYAHEHAIRHDAQMGVIERLNGTLTNIDDEPLFVLFGNELVTSPLCSGANDTVMRRLTFKTTKVEGIQISEYPLQRDMLNLCDEVFTLSTQGIISINGYRRQRYYNLMANRLMSQFNKLALP